MVSNDIFTTSKSQQSLFYLDTYTREVYKYFLKAGVAQG